MGEHNSSQQIPTDGGSTPPRNSPEDIESFNPNSGPINPNPAMSAPTTRDEAEGSADINEQSETSPAPSQLEPAEGAGDREGS